MPPPPRLRCRHGSDHSDRVDCRARSNRKWLSARKVMLGTRQRRGGDSNPRCRDYRHNGFRDRRIQPLCHLSAKECIACPYPLQPFLQDAFMTPNSGLRLKLSAANRYNEVKLELNLSCEKSVLLQDIYKKSCPGRKMQYIQMYTTPLCDA